MDNCAVENDVLLVVVGAGASYATVGDGDSLLQVEGLPTVLPSDARPPLTQGLVGPGLLQDQILARYPMAKPLVAELRDVLASPSPRVVAPFEQLLADYERSAADNPARRRHLMALRFYLRDLLWACTDYSTQPGMGSGMTRYHRLVNELHHWAHLHGRHVCFVVFNYDLILENACRDVFGFAIDDLSSHVTHPLVSVVKPHGSVNWVWPVQRGSQFGSRALADETVIRDAAADSTPPLGSIAVAPAPPHRKWMGTAPTAVPALALPVAGKSEFVWPEAHESFVRDRLRTRVRGVLTLGWRGMEPHFLDLLPPLVREGSRLALVTGGPTAQRDADELSQRLVGTLSPAAARVATDNSGLPTTLRSHLEWIEPGFS
jgi:hypothetical protein